MSKIEGTRIALDTVGCKLNQAETELLARELVQAGYRVVSPAEGADVYILNTCTVTQMADSKCRHLLRMARRRNPAARLVVTGCYAERVPEALAKLEGVDLVLGNEDKPHLLRRLAERGFLTIPISTQGDSPDAFRTRAFIKIQDGCHNFCAYCIVPLVRRNEVSVAAGQVTAEIRQRVAEGYKEVVLTGTEVGSYRCDGISLAGLLARILAETEITRLRLSSLQPQEISPELVSLWRGERLCRHFHLSLQSGSDSVLRRMKRRYSASEYASAVSLIRDNISGVAITTDIIVGFPDETDAEFEKSYDFCQRMEFARIHVFPYSIRAGTAAAGMPDQVKASVKKERSQQMLALAKECIHDFSQRFLGKTITVLWEKKSGSVWSGHTDNYIKVYTKNANDLTNKLLETRLTKVSGDGVWGEISG